MMDRRRMTALGALVCTLTLFVAAAPPPDAPVADAAMRGDVEQVRSLLRSGADVNAAQGDGMTALHWAAQNGNAELAEVLIYAGADVHAGTRIGDYTPLHVASRTGHAAVVEVLLEAGGDPNAVTTNSGATPLHLAAASGSRAAVSALLDHGIDVNVRESTWGQTPLIFAASYDRADVIEELLERGADPSIASRPVDVPERAAADDAAEDRLNEVLDGFRQEDGGGDGWEPTPSQVQAAIEEAREVQRAWPDVPQADDENGDSENGEDEDGDDEDGENGDEAEADEPEPLSYADLVGTWGGLTPLLHATRQGHEAAVRALLDGGAAIDEPSAGTHVTPLLMATINGHFDLAMMLLEEGAAPDVASEAGTTALYAAIDRQWASKASYSHPTDYQQQETTYLELMEALLEAGADPNVRLEKHLWYMQYTFDLLARSGLRARGATPFWRAAWALDVDAMRLLKEYGADPSIPTKKAPERRRGDDEETEEEEDPSGLPPVPVDGPAIYPIHAASGVGYGEGFIANSHRHAPGAWLPAVRFLVEECGADVNRRDHKGYNAVHHAAARGDNEMIHYLVEKGADVTAVARSGQTTADMANGPVQRVPPYTETIELLESLGSENNDNCLSC